MTCCEQAELLSETKTGRYGNFFIKKLDAGDYFLILKGSSPTLSIPILVEKAYESKACDIDQRFTVDAATGKTEITAIVEVD
jgi:hypothetical protein